MAESRAPAKGGLEGVVAADSAIASIDGEKGALRYRGYLIKDLADHSNFVETTWLLWHGELPQRAQLRELGSQLAAHRELPPAALDVLARVAREQGPMDALRTVVSVLSIDDVPGDVADLTANLQRGARLVARFPTIVAAYWRLYRGVEPIAPEPELGHAANFLYMLTGQPPDAERVRGLETYLNTVVDHGLNASTFTARVITSTGSDLVSAVVGALGALKGPLHGGAPGPALDMVFEIGEASRAEVWLRRKIEAGDKLMGFGHRVYKVRDPRADVLAAAAERMYTRAGDQSLYTLARAVEAAALRLLEEYKPGRRLQTNVEFYTALLLHGLGLEVPLFTSTFAIGRVSGWLAHAFEQRTANRIIRPQSEYVGPRDRRWVAIERRDGVDAVAARAG